MSWFRRKPKLSRSPDEEIINGCFLLVGLAIVVIAVVVFLVVTVIKVWVS